MSLTLLPMLGRKMKDECARRQPAGSWYKAPMAISLPLVLFLVGTTSFCSASPAVLDHTHLQQYVGNFNADDVEQPAGIRNRDAYAFLKNNIPLFDCPDEDFRRTYYFRWWTYRKHIKDTADGYVVTEFLPEVGWAGKHNTISCPAGHHFYEGRWLHDSRILDDYAVFWLRKGGSPRAYSFWIADAFYNRDLVTPNAGLLTDLLPDLIENYRAWEEGWVWPPGNTKHQFHIGGRDNGLFFTVDDRDGGEVSIGGHGFRPTLNSFMYGDAKAIAAIAGMAGEKEIAEKYGQKAESLKQLVQEKLWDSEAGFFKVLPGPALKAGPFEEKPLRNVRELYGFTPWYFNLPDPGYENGWKELMDPGGFYAPYGPTFAEQRHPRFAVSYQGHECQWNGPSWPLATSTVLTALANLLNNYKQDVIGEDAYFETLKIYTKSQRLKREDGKEVPWIDENLDPYTGNWIARTRLHEWAKSDPDLAERKGGLHRGKDYNHSTYNDLIITGLVGLRPREDDIVEVNPLLPEDVWDWFCLDNVLYHGKILTVIWDKTGKKYGSGRGLTLLIDGEKAANSPGLARITAPLNP